MKTEVSLVIVVDTTQSQLVNKTCSLYSFMINISARLKQVELNGCINH